MVPDKTNNLNPRKRLVLNSMQLMLEIAPQRIRTVQVGRGGGKSTGAAIDIKNVTFDMPMSKNFILGETYQNILTKTLPSTIKALSFIGLHEGIHYFFGRKPPVKWKWPKCYEPPMDPSHSIFFFNGTVWDLLSEDVSSRGANYASGMVDEAQDADETYFKSNVIPTLRLEKNRLGNKRTYRRVSLYCSMPRTRKAEWVFNYEEMARKFPKEYLWIEGSSHINADNLPDGWFEDQRQLLLPSEYAIEIDNKRPQKVTGGFYHMFDDKLSTYVDFNNDYLDGIISNSNGYRSEDFQEMNCLQDNDLLLDEPLEISMDYGGWFNGIITFQESNNVGRWLSGMSIDDKQRFEDLLNMWCLYYRFHRNRLVYYWYDHTAKDRDARTEEYPAIVCRVLRSFGFTVIEMYIGAQPSPEDRYKFWGYAHKGDHPNLPKFMYNRHHCKYVIISMNGAKIKQGSTSFQKDKTDEKDQKIDQRTTTHFSDAMDTLAMGKYGHRVNERIKVIRPRLS